MHVAPDQRAAEHKVNHHHAGDAVHQCAHRGAHAVRERPKAAVEFSEKAAALKMCSGLHLLEHRGAERGRQSQSHND